MATKTLADAVTGVNRTARTVTAWVSREVLDRDGEILLAAGADLQHYRANPVVLFGHDARLPVGKALTVGAVPGTGVESTMKFANTAFASEVLDLFAEGVLRAFSVGFRGLKAFESRALADGTRARVLPEWELLEASAVAVPANPLALAKAAGGNRAAGVIFAAYYPEATRNLLAANGQARKVTDADLRKLLGQVGEIRDGLRQAVVMRQLAAAKAAVTHARAAQEAAIGRAVARELRRAPLPARR